MPCTGRREQRRAVASGGFSLVEVLVSSLLLITAITGLAHLFALAAQANVEARYTTYATVLAAQRIEELRAAAFPDAAVESVDYLDAQGGLLTDGAASGRAIYRRDWVITPLPADPVDTVVITVVVSPRAAASRGTVRLTTIKTRKGR